MDAKYFLSGVKATLQAAMDENLLPPQPVEPLAHVLSAALNEASMLIAHADDAVKARVEVSKVIDRLLEGVRAGGS